MYCEKILIKNSYPVACYDDLDSECYYFGVKHKCDHDNWHYTKTNHLNIMKVMNMTWNAVVMEAGGDEPDPVLLNMLSMINIRGRLLSSSRLIVK